MNLFRYITLVFITCLFLSCTTKGNKETSKSEVSYHPAYAQGFEINRRPNYTEVIVKSPWIKNEIMERYYLVDNDKTEVPQDGQKILVPLKSLGVASCTHFEFLQLLNESNSITGICSPELVYNQSIVNNYKDGKIMNMGDAFNLNFEQVLFLHPNAVMVSGIDQFNEKEKRIIQAGIPVIYNNEWTEISLLGRAEWIKFVAVFYDKEKVADSIFSVIEKDYHNARNIAQQVEAKPTILSGSNFKGTWYMSGGKSYIGHLFADAGSNYFYKNDTTQTSLPLSFEMVLKEFRNADYWIGCNASTIEELLGQDERYALFDATTSGKVYNFNNRITSTGGNDFWESGVAHPDLILNDLVKILHTELLPGYELVYMKKVE